jgi:hypothetical protein
MRIHVFSNTIYLLLYSFRCPVGFGYVRELICSPGYRANVIEGSSLWKHIMELISSAGVNTEEVLMMLVEDLCGRISSYVDLQESYDVFPQRTSVEYIKTINVNTRKIEVKLPHSPCWGFQVPLHQCQNLVNNAFTSGAAFLHTSSKVQALEVFEFWRIYDRVSFRKLEGELHPVSQIHTLIKSYVRCQSVAAW